MELSQIRRDRLIASEVLGASLTTSSYIRNRIQKKNAADKEAPNNKEATGTTKAKVDLHMEDIVFKNIYEQQKNFPCPGQLVSRN